jgi:putative transposase
MCVLLEVSRAGYYAWKKRVNNPDRNEKRKELIKEAHIASHQTYGYRRVQTWIKQKYGLQINHKAVLRLMNELGIHSVARRRKFLKKPKDIGVSHRYPNILDRGFSADHPNQKWVTDITFVHTKQGWAYLSVIKDLHDGFIVAYNFTKQNTLNLVTNTLKRALQKEVVTDGLVLHSDQGFQYSSQMYYALTKEYNISPSLSRRGNCWDNAPMENFFGHLKEEALRRFPNPSFQEASQTIDEYIYFYNYERIQLKTRQTPYQLRCLFS